MGMDDAQERNPQRGQVWGVGDLVRAVQDALNQRWPTVRVQGEISGLSRPASGHLYFSLKDADGQPALVRCAMFRRAASLLDMNPRDGARVEIRGRLTVYEPRGDLQLVVESMQPQGAGSLYEEFLRLRAKLEAQGLFDPAGRKPLPRFPQRIGVVTSLGAAALRDVLTTLRRRAPHVPVIVYPILVQGAEAPGQVAAALALAVQRREVDVVLLVRGGGSLEDLWSFNDERVVRAVRACALPIIVGVGHETDITLADLAADLRAPTPTAAAELAVVPRAELIARLMQCQTSMQAAADRAIDRRAQTLDLLTARLGQPAGRLQAQGVRLQAWQDRLQRAYRARLAHQPERLAQWVDRIRRARRHWQERQSSRLEGLALRLEAAHPDRVLQRGFARLETADGRTLARVAQAEVGQTVVARLADGSLHTVVRSVVPCAQGDPTQ
jgi:exodeoxyribonuclease VII large subunit